MLLLFVGLLGFCTFKAFHSPTSALPPARSAEVRTFDERDVEAVPSPMLPRTPFHR